MQVFRNVEDVAQQQETIVDLAAVLGATLRLPIVLAVQQHFHVLQHTLRRFAVRECFFHVDQQLV